MVFLAALALPLPAAPAAPPDEAEKLRHATGRLAAQLELASGNGYYLILDAGRRELRLMLEGVVLREYPVREIAIGRRRVLFVERDLPAGWRDVIWEAGRLDPPRRKVREEIVPPDGEEAGEEEAAPEIPPTPEEAVPAPSRYRLRYRGGLALEVVPGEGARPGLLHGLVDGLGSLWPWGGDRVRVRLALDPADAGSFYRSVPEETRLLILPEDP